MIALSVILTLVFIGLVINLNVTVSIYDRIQEQSESLKIVLENYNRFLDERSTLTKPKKIKKSVTSSSPSASETFLPSILMHSDTPAVNPSHVVEQ